MTGQALDIRSGFAERLEHEILRRGLTVEEMAQLLGVTERQVRRWRNGETEPRLATYRMYARRLSWKLPPGSPR
jgi:transcriptional regulator with XRE-family HTH domain